MKTMRMCGLHSTSISLLTSTSNECVFILCLCIVCLQSAPVKEYCQIEKFSGKCQDGEIIVMDYAFYGRMNAGRCISGEGQLGCGTDARVHMDGLCSGRRTCEVSVFTLAEIFNPCKRDYTLYLEAAYSCKSVVVDESDTCRQNSSPVELLKPSGLIASTYISENRAGTMQCPWLIQAQLGQQVQLNVVVYKPGIDPGFVFLPGSNTASVCPWTVFMEEDEKTGQEALCGKGRSQKGTVMSQGNTVKVYFSWQGRTEDIPVFVIYYEVIGCSDLLPVGATDGAAVTRSGDAMEVRCRDSRETWYLTCIDNIWVGDLDNCSSKSSLGSLKATGYAIPFPQGLVVAVVLGLLLGLVIGTASLALLFFCRSRTRRGRSREEDEEKYEERLTERDVKAYSGYHRTTACQMTGHELAAMDMLRASPQTFHGCSSLKRPGRLAQPLVGALDKQPQPSGNPDYTGPVTPGRYFGSPEIGGGTRAVLRGYERPKPTGTPLAIGQELKVYFELDPEQRRAANVAPFEGGGT